MYHLRSIAMIFWCDWIQWCWKSTLVRLVNHLEAASSGQVLVDGHDITNYSEKGMREIKRYRYDISAFQFIKFSYRI